MAAERSTSGEYTAPTIAMRTSSMRGLRGSAKWNGSWSNSSERTSSCVAAWASRAHADRTCARRAAGSKVSSSCSRPSSQRADGTPAETIVPAGRPGNSIAWRSATKAPKEWPSTT